MTSDISQPQISVVMAVYNGERFLQAAIDSVLGQTFQDFEFIIVDDASTDNTPTILQAASKSDPRRDNDHPTVKPTDLMQYLCRLVSPPGGTVLDPFMGSGPTGAAARKEGVRFIEAQDDDIQNMVDWDRARKTTTDDVKTIRRKMYSHNHIYVGSLGTIGVIVIEKYIFLAVLAWGLLHRPKKSGTIENPQQVEDTDAE